MGTLQGSWVWYELMTTDPESAKAFYEPVIGWQIDIGNSSADTYNFITAPSGSRVGGILRLTEDMREHGARPAWLGYIGVDDVEATVANVAAQGGRCTLPPRDVEMAGRIAMIDDPGGVPVYVMKPAPPPGSEGGESLVFQAESNPGHCGWNELIAADPVRETTFYTRLFGWSLPDAMDMGAMGRYQFVAHDGVTHGAIMGVTPQDPAPHWNHYFWVPSIAVAKEAIEERGGKVISGPMEVPGGGWIIQGVDPQGASFSLVGGQ